LLPDLIHAGLRRGIKRGIAGFGPISEPEPSKRFAINQGYSGVGFAVPQVFLDGHFDLAVIPDVSEMNYR
jgi:hypothetical protein